MMPCVSPESRINGILSPNCRNTSSPLAQVGDPERFALVPVNGTPSSRISRVTTSFFGQRSATRLVFAVTFSGNRFDASTTIVSGPGQHASASLKKLSGRSFARIAACSSELIRIGRARDSGRPLTRKISSIAARFTGSAASAYKVSVGIAITAPRFNHPAA